MFSCSFRVHQVPTNIKHCSTSTSIYWLMLSTRRMSIMRKPQRVVGANVWVATHYLLSHDSSEGTSTSCQTSDVYYNAFRYNIWTLELFGNTGTRGGQYSSPYEDQRYIVRSEKSTLKEIDTDVTQTFSCERYISQQTWCASCVAVFQLYFTIQSVLFTALLVKAMSSTIGNSSGSYTWGWKQNVDPSTCSADSIWDARIIYMYCASVARASFENDPALETLLKLFPKLKDPGK